MAKRNPLLATWVRDAYGMELGLVTTLEKQIKEVQNDSPLQKGISRHLEQTRQHVNLLRDCLQRMGENPAQIQPASPLANRFSQPTENNPPDATLRTGLIDYVTESFEVASYQALNALARQAGDNDTAQACERILQDEMMMVRSLDQILPGISTGTGTGTSQRTTGGQAGGSNASMARGTHEALNSHDLSRWDQFNAEDYQGESPATTGPMNRQQNRDYLQNFLTAFPDLHFEVLRTIEQGEFVVINWSGTGTHTGPFRGPDGSTFQPTRKKATEYGTTTFEFRNGKVRRTWNYFDMSELMKQLGLMPGATR